MRDLTFLVLYGINLAGPTRSEPLNRQRFERVRARGYFIDVIDEGFGTLMRYYYENQKIYANFAVSTQQISYKKDKLDCVEKQINKDNPIPSDVIFGKCRAHIKRQKEYGTS